VTILISIRPQDKKYIHFWPNMMQFFSSSFVICIKFELLNSHKLYNQYCTTYTGVTGNIYRCDRKHYKLFGFVENLVLYPVVKEFLKLLKYDEVTAMSMVAFFKHGV